MEDPSSTAYVFQGDPLHDDLCQLFAPENNANEQPDMHVEPLAENLVEENRLANEPAAIPNNEVIVISDDDEVQVEMGLNPNSRENIVDLSSDEEVVPILNFHDDEYESLEFKTSDEEEALVDSPSMNVEAPCEVVDDHPSFFRYGQIIPQWIAPPNRGMINRYNFDYRFNEDETGSSDDSSLSTRMLNSRRY